MKRFLVLLSLAFSLAGGVSALDWQAWSLDLGLAYQVNAEIGTGAAKKEPGKLMFNPGASVYADWDGEPGGLFFHPGAWFSWSIEEVYEGVARPCDEAEISHMKVLGLMADAPFGYLFRAGGLDVGLQGGPALYLRFPLFTAQEGTGEPSDFWNAYYGNAQFLHLSLASWVQFPVAETMEFRTGLRFYFPLANFWTAAPIAHGIQIGLTASLRFRLPDGRES